jgi:hypothetical protein
VKMENKAFALISRLSRQPGCWAIVLATGLLLSASLLASAYLAALIQGLCAVVWLISTAVRSAYPQPEAAGQNPVLAYLENPVRKKIKALNLFVWKNLHDYFIVGLCLAVIPAMAPDSAGRLLAWTGVLLVLCARDLTQLDVRLAALTTCRTKTVRIFLVRRISLLLVLMGSSTGLALVFLRQEVRLDNFTLIGLSLVGTWAVGKILLAGAGGKR